MSFIKNWLGVQGKQAVEAVNTALVRLDPEAAIQADLDTMNQDVNKAGQVIAKLRTDLVREQKEAEAIERRYGEMMGAAEHLQAQIADPALADKRPSREASLARLLDQIEKIVPDIEREKQDVSSTQALLADAEKAYQEKVAALTQAKGTLTRARQDMQHAAIREDRAKQRAEQAEVVAGLKSAPTSQLTVALGTMQRATEQAQQRTEAANMKAQALAGARDQEDDPNIAEALKAAKGEPAQRSLAERLAALRQ